MQERAKPRTPAKVSLAMSLPSAFFGRVKSRTIAEMTAQAAAMSHIARTDSSTAKAETENSHSNKQTIPTMNPSIRDSENRFLSIIYTPILSDHTHHIAPVGSVTSTSLRNETAFERPSFWLISESSCSMLMA